MQAAVDTENRTRYESLFEEFLTLLIASGTDRPGDGG
jgi:hypothetical protein